MLFKCRYLKKPKRLAYKVYCIIEIALCVFLIISFGFELRTNHSIIACCLQARNFEFSIPEILSVKAIRKVAETVGFGSIIIAWIYAVLDKKELGIKYSDLLTAVYPKYHWFVPVHLVAIFMCIWLANVEVLEGSLIALLIVLWGCIIQWKALSSLIFRSEKRKSIALDEWHRFILKCKTESDYQSVMYGMTDAFSEQDRLSFERLYNNISYGMLSYVKFSLNKDTSDTIIARTILPNISNIWNRLMLGRSQDEHFAIQNGIISAIREEKKWKPLNIGLVCAGYIRWLHEYYTDRDDENILIKMFINTRILMQREIKAKEDEDAITHYVKLIYAFYVWMRFLYDDIPFSVELFEKDTISAWDNDDVLLRSFAKSVFIQYPVEKYFDVVCTQIFNCDD